MNRRQFLTGVSALAVASALPAEPAVTGMRFTSYGGGFTIAEEIMNPVLRDVRRAAFVPRIFLDIEPFDPE